MNKTHTRILLVPKCKNTPHTAAHKNIHTPNHQKTNSWRPSFLTPHTYTHTKPTAKKTQQLETDSASPYVLESFPSFDTAVDEFFARLEAQKIKQARILID